MLAGIGQMRLREVPEIDKRDCSTPKLTGYATEADVGTYQNSVLDANIEKWIDALGDNTFPSAFLPLTEAHAQMFVDAYEALQLPGARLATLPAGILAQVRLRWRYCSSTKRIGTARE